MRTAKRAGTPRQGCPLHTENTIGAALTAYLDNTTEPQTVQAERKDCTWKSLQRERTATMTRDEALEYINKQVPTFLQKVAHGYVCPYCGQGANKGNGVTRATGRPQLWHCVSCQKERSIIGLFAGHIGIADTPENLYDLLNRAAAYYGIDVDQTRRTYTDAHGAQREYIPRTTPQEPAGPQEAASSPTEDYTAYYAECEKRLAWADEAQEYLKSRGISLATAQAHGIGFDPAWKHPKAPKMKESPRLIIPIGSGNYLARYTGSGDYIDYKGEKQNKSKVTATQGQPWTFNSAALYAPDAEAVFITEGEIDALSIIEAGAPAAAIGSAAYTGAFIDQLEKRRPTAKLLVLCLDNDQEGEKATEKLKEGLTRLKIPFIDLHQQICGTSKDPNEALQHELEGTAGFRQAIATAREGAATVLEAMQEQAQREELERQQRTGPVMVDLFLEAIQTRKYEPIPTGIKDIDQALGGGFMRQWLCLLGAPPGAGKTALAQWIFEGMAQRGTTCLYLNLEMSREQMLARSISRIAAQGGDRVTPAEVLQGYKWTIEQEDAVKTAADKYRRTIAPRMVYNPIGEDTNIDSILKYITEEAERAEAAGLPAPIVILDYLQVVTGGQREEKADLIQRVIQGLKEFAIAHNTLVFAIMAQNRESNRTGVSSMESGRDTSNIEYGADLLLGLDFTECLYRGDNHKGKKIKELTREEKKLKTLTVHKSRFSEDGAQVDLRFDGATMSFHQLVKDFDEPPQRAVTMRI